MWSRHFAPREGLPHPTTALPLAPGQPPPTAGACHALPPPPVAQAAHQGAHLPVLVLDVLEQLDPVVGQAWGARTRGWPARSIRHAGPVLGPSVCAPPKDSAHSRLRTSTCKWGPAPARPADETRAPRPGGQLLTHAQAVVKAHAALGHRAAQPRHACTLRGGDAGGGVWGRAREPVLEAQPSSSQPVSPTKARWKGQQGRAAAGQAGRPVPATG